MPGPPCNGVIYYQQATHEAVKWTICKTMHSGVALYTLTRGKNDKVASADNSAELKQMAEEML
jgi:hypothetical protein